MVICLAMLTVLCTFKVMLNSNKSNLKIHGHWKSDAIWSYLSDTPKAASVVASAFQQHIT